MKTAIPAVLAFALLGFTAHANAAPNCNIRLKGDDRMQFDLKSVTVSASCPKITIALARRLPAAAMGHDVVVSRSAAAAPLPRLSSRPVPPAATCPGRMSA